jgi:hypothetical protein
MRKVKYVNSFSEKEVFNLKQKLYVLLAGTVLSALVLGGCNRDVDNHNRIAPQRINNPVNDNRDLDNNLNRNNMNNDVNDRLNDNYYPESEDRNTDADKDMFKDRNSKHEEIIEDDRDARDRDKKDE